MGKKWYHKSTNFSVFHLFTNSPCSSVGLEICGLNVTRQKLNLRIVDLLFVCREVVLTELSF